MTGCPNHIKLSEASPFLKINPNLIWDYDIPSQRLQTEAFRRWYVARVLMRGGVQDIRDVGLRTILHYLPLISVPARIRAFWKWYFEPRPDRQNL